MKKNNEVCVRLDQQEVCLPVTKREAEVVSAVLATIAVVGLWLAVGRLISSR